MEVQIATSNLYATQHFYVLGAFLINITFLLFMKALGSRWYIISILRKGNIRVHALNHFSKEPPRIALKKDKVGSPAINLLYN